MDVTATFQLPAGFRFIPEDEFLVVQLLLRRLRNKPLCLPELVLVDDPYSANPELLLGRNGRDDIAYFFARRTAKHNTGGRFNRQIPGGGTWRGQKRVAGDVGSILVGGGETVKWEKYNLCYNEGREKKSSGWVMQEYQITNAESLAGIQEKGWVLCCVKRTEASKKRQRETKDEDLGASRARSRRIAASSYPGASIEAALPSPAAHMITPALPVHQEIQDLGPAVEITTSGAPAMEEGGEQLGDGDDFFLNIAFEDTDPLLLIDEMGLPPARQEAMSAVEIRTSAPAMEEGCGQQGDDDDFFLNMTFEDTDPLLLIGEMGLPPARQEATPAPPVQEEARLEDNSWQEFSLYELFGCA